MSRLRGVAAFLLLFVGGCGMAEPVRVPETLVVLYGTDGELARWCATGRIRPFGHSYYFTDRDTGENRVVPKAMAVLSVRPDSTCAADASPKGDE